MAEALPLGEIATLLAVLATAGLFVGFFAGLLGIGGGGLLVPVLFEVFGYLEVPPEIRMHMAIGTSLGVMIPTTVRGYYAHRKRGNTDGALVARLVLPIFAGVVIGSIIAKWSSGDFLKWFWIVFSLLMVSKLVFGRESWRLGDDVPKSRLVELYGVAVGAIATIMSVGGGAYITALLTLYGRPIQQAVGTSSGIGPIVAIPGMLGFVWAGWSVADLPLGSLGYVNMIGFAALVPTSVLMAPVGARVAQGINGRTLELVMAAFIFSASMRFLYAVIFGS